MSMNKKSPAQIRKDLKELWPAIPIAAVAFAWFLQPVMAFASADGMARVGLLMAVTIVATRALIVQKEPRAGMISALFAAFVAGMSVLVFFGAGDADRRNQRQCAHQERIMLTPSAEGRHALAVFGALKCRPTGIIPSTKAFSKK